MIAEHPTSGAKQTILGSAHWLWCALFGWIYYLSKGMWGIALISFVTMNGLLVILPIMNRGLVRKHYENKGWRILE